MDLLHFGYIICLNNMKLNIKERLSILQMLPETGNIMEMVDIMEIIKKIRLSDTEKVDIDYKEANGTISWNINKDSGLDVEFTHDEVSILKNSVKKLDQDKKVNISNLDMCLKINKL